MDAGLALFDDDLFNCSSSSRDETSRRDAQYYTPKIESNCWFFDDSSISPDCVDFVEKHRMKAAYFYLRRDYANAVRVYHRLLEVTSSGALQLEFMESYARALIGCDRFEDAERSSVEFYQWAINFDQQLQALNLLSDVYWCGKAYQKCAVTSACLSTQIGDTNPHIWYRLAWCFRKWNNLDGINDDRDDYLINTRNIPALSEESTVLLFQQCLIRAHAMFFACYHTSVGFARQQNEKMRLQIEKEIRDVFGSCELLVGLRKRGLVETTDGQEDEQTCGNDKTCNDKMISSDLVTAFDEFLRKWLDSED